ncbi:MAG TPA: porin family protein [Gemmatimonadaceae bacterium]|nr:porin family protein [Gemmatimonadaceae bacterium]
MGLTFVAPAARAQGGDMIPHPSWGIVAGANFANVTGDDFDDGDNRTGFMAGVTGTFHFTRMFALNTGLLFSQEGSKDPNSDLAIHENMLQLPILARVAFPTSTGKVTPFIEAGPTAAFSLSCKFTDGDDDVDCDDFTGTDVKKFEFGVAGGAGLRFNAGTHAIEVGGRYQQALTDALKDADAKNKVISVFAGFTI